MFEQARNICIEILRNIKNPSTTDINNAIDNVFKILPDILHEREKLFNYLAATFSVFSDEYHILDSDTGYIPWLKNKKSEISWRFWNRYSSFIRKKISPDTLNKLDNLTDDILDRISDPSISGSWDKRGMVVGQVQSGKTSNYIGLINKAADTGYKLIIVLAGMHDSLRSQTQIRIDEGFLGFNSQHSLQYSNTNKIGVGIFNPTDPVSGSALDLPANALTTSNLNGDFNRKVAQSNGIHLRSTDPIVAVTKKNGSILKNLISWLALWGDKQPDGKIIIRNIPLLLIDDEADNASINVSKEKVSTINGCIRALLSLFEQSSYVGYTATPFANIFIPILDQETVKGLDLNIKDFEFTVGQDLFPKDFIINIPAPSNYIGPEKVFGLPSSDSSEISEEPLPLIRLIKDYDQGIPGKKEVENSGLFASLSNDPVKYTHFVPDKHKKNDPLPEELPLSLKYAIKCFILSTAARRVRKQIEVHNSMLIHVSRFIIWQDRIASLVDAELKFYQRQIEMNTGFVLADLREIWYKDYIVTTNAILNEPYIYKDPEISKISWEEISKELYAASAKMEVRAVHGDKKLDELSYHNISPLDYFASEQSGTYLSVIAVGGDKLSRGLTLEGLTVSYYLRASKMYDTLMQMGRWFGYRPGYVDLCRIFTSRELSKWYKHITIASDEMKRDFDYMFHLKKTPKEYGLKVRTHPGVLKITAANKFRYKKYMYLSYSGSLEQTHQFIIDNKLFRNNYKATLELIAKLGKFPESQANTINPKQKLIWEGENNSNIITQFLSNYKVEPAVIDINKIVDYINAQANKGNLVNWTVALIDNTTASQENNFLFPGIEKPVGLTDRTNISTDELIYEVAKNNITDHRHELIDLTDDEIDKALQLSIADSGDPDKKNLKIPSRKRIKYIRNSKNALLIIYPLNHNCQYSAISDTGEKSVYRKLISEQPIIGIAISFPEIENDEKIEYAVNEQFINEFDYPEELDQTDIEDGTD